MRLGLEARGLKLEAQGTGLDVGGCGLGLFKVLRGLAIIRRTYKVRFCIIVKILKEFKDSSSFQGFIGPCRISSSYGLIRIL